MEQFEEFIRNGLQDYSPQVPDGCWESVSRQLEMLHAGGAFGKVTALWGSVATKITTGIVVVGALSAVGYRLLSSLGEDGKPHHAEESMVTIAAPLSACYMDTASQDAAYQAVASMDNATGIGGEGVFKVTDRETATGTAGEGISKVTTGEGISETAGEDATMTAVETVASRGVTPLDAAREDAAYPDATVHATGASVTMSASVTSLSSDTKNTNSVPMPTSALGAGNASLGTAKATSNATYAGKDSFSLSQQSAHSQPSLRIPNVITPNGDNINDYLIVEGMENLSNTRMVIYNRQGKVVYEKRDYDNGWSAEKLPAGTYFYWFTFEYEGYGFMRQGSVQVIR